MTKNVHSVIFLPIKVLLRATDQTKQSVFEVINRGYDIPRFKYGIILSSRLKSVNHLFSDLGFDKNEENCFMYLLVKDVDLALPNFHHSFRKIEEVSTDHLPVYYSPKFDAIDTPLDISRVLATIAYKPNGNDRYEITAFTSSAKGCGIKLYNYSILHMQAQTHLSCKRLLAHVVMEHDLVGYYEKKLGFKEIDRFLFKNDEENSSGFKDDILISQDFHVVELEKWL